MMKKFPMNCGRNMAIYAALAVAIAPCARAQRVEPEVQPVDASVHAGVEEQARARALAQKTTERPAAGSAWTASATQPSRSLFRPGGAAAAPHSAGHSSISHSTTTPSAVKSAPPPALASKPAFSLPVAAKPSGTFSSSPGGSTTSVRGHAPLKRGKVLPVIREEKQK